ncbi:hypothetical protein RB5AMG_01691 [Ruminococcus bromii]|nr:hypothetical protein RB5AMG_01691 [Ruminococcus bromii]
MFNYLYHIIRDMVIAMFFKYLNIYLRGDFVSATIGAALKKIAVSLLTDKKVIKTIGGIIIGIIIIVVMPIIAVVSVFNGSMDLDTDKLNQSIQENISAEQMENLQLINDTMTEVENQLKSKKLSDYNTQAEVIYLFYLSDKSKEKDFVKNFVSCFKKNQSGEDLIKTVNQKFGTEIKYDEFQKMMQSIKGAEISTAGFTDKTTKNNLDLVKWCENAYKNGWGYVYGGYGQVCTKQYLDQQASLFPGNNEAGGEMRQVGEKWLGKKVCDCIGLIKSYAWYNADSGEIVAGSNGFTDCGANSIWSSVTESGPISNMPDTPGLAVWMDGHIGVYIGNGEVIEAQGTAYGVVKTELNGRGWTKWLKIPNIKYIDKNKK